MKAVLKVLNINSSDDVVNIKNCITDNEGIIAFQIMEKTGEIEVVYDGHFVNLERIIDSIEVEGYTVM